MVVPEELFSQGTKSDVSSLEQTPLVRRIIFILKDIAVCFQMLGQCCCTCAGMGLGDVGPSQAGGKSLVLHLSQGPIPVAYSTT